MGIWDKFFGNTTGKKTKESPYMPIKEDPIDIIFAKNFTSKGGRFLFCIYFSIKSSLHSHLLLIDLILQELQ